MNILASQQLMQDILSMSVEQLRFVKIRVSKITNSESSTAHELVDAQEIIEQLKQRESALEQAHLDDCRNKIFKTCIACGKDKPVDDSYFGFGFKTTGIPKARCKACYRERAANHHSNNLEQGRARSQYHRDKRNLYVEGVISEEEKNRLRKLQRNKCAYCGQGLGTDGELDHYIPVELGGSNDITNRVWACQTCNRNKGRKMPEEFLRAKKRYGVSVRRGGFFAPPKAEISTTSGKNVAWFATELGLPIKLLLKQLQAAGVDKKNESDPICEKDKTQLLEYLRIAHNA